MVVEWEKIGGGGGGQSIIMVNVETETADWKDWRLHVHILAVSESNSACT